VLTIAQERPSPFDIHGHVEKSWRSCGCTCVTARPESDIASIDVSRG
jgi:hypothetical protein